MVGVDQNPQFIDGITCFHDKESIDIKQFDLVVISPGVPPSHHLVIEAGQQGVEVIGEAELAFRSMHNPVLGITGTNGKTTVTLLCTHVLNHCDKVAYAMGNVGVPLTEPHDGIIVAEMSSFQLETMSSQVLDAAVILNISPDHLDRYDNMDEYAAAKIKIKDCLKPNAPLFMDSKTYNQFHHLLGNVTHKLYDLISFQENIEYISHIEYTVIENIQAAYALCRVMGVSEEQFLQTLPSFKKPAHRMEFVRKFSGVNYYNDSKGTNIDAVKRAVESMKGKVILIAGGIDKGASYSYWLEPFAGKVKCVCVIGQAAQKIKTELESQLAVEIFENMTDAIHYATTLAKPGENVLLSPGCSSFDMFNNYRHRGEEFKKFVRELR